MNGKCLCCGAYYFQCETNCKKEFTKCCQNETVMIPNFDNYNVPEFLEVLLTDTEHKLHKNFREDIRQYNSASSFASFGAQQGTQFEGRGPYCFRIQGTTYHETSNLKPGGGHEVLDMPNYTLMTLDLLLKRGAKSQQIRNAINLYSKS